MKCSPSGSFVLFYIDYLEPLMFWIGEHFPSLPWHMWKPCPAKHIIQPDPGLGSQRIRGCYATHRQAAESGRQPLSGARRWTRSDLSFMIIIRRASHTTGFYTSLGDFPSCHLRLLRTSEISSNPILSVTLRMYPHSRPLFLHIYFRSREQLTRILLTKNEQSWTVFD